MKTLVEAKVFKNGGSNAIRIPAAFKLDVPIVYLSFDDESGEITVSKNKPRPFAKLLELHAKHGVISESEWQLVRDPEDLETRPSLRELTDLK